jgi:hypothetical protein
MNSPSSSSTSSFSSLLTTATDNTLSSSIFNCKPEDFLNSGFYRTKTFKDIICSGCGWQSTSEGLTLKHLNFMHKVCNPDCKMSRYTDGDYVNYLKYKKSVKKTEDMLEDTFLMWPKSYPNIKNMIQAGFYYTGVGDATACISCGVVLEHWNLEDDPEKEHRKASPYCEIFQ